MLIERGITGAWVISSDGMTRTYFGYTKREAVAMFKAEKKEGK